MADFKSHTKELLKSFFLAFKRLSFYAVDHPLSKEILSNLFKMFEALLKDEREILIVVGLNADEVLINNDAFGHETLGASEIHNRFKAFKLDGFNFIRGLTFRELVAFVQAVASPAILDGGKPAPVPELLKSGSEHIKVKKVRYERLEEGQKVVAEGDTPVAPMKPGVVAEGDTPVAPMKPGVVAEGDTPVAPMKPGVVAEGDIAGLGLGPGGGPGEGGPGGAGAAQEIASQIKNFLTGKVPEIKRDETGILEKFHEDAQAVADAIIESVRESGDFEAVIRRFVAWLTPRLVPVLVEKKREPEKFIDKFFSTFKKEEFGIRPEERDRVIEECADDIKISLIREAYLAKKGSPRKPLNLAARVLVDEEDQKRILPKIQGGLVAGGVPAEEAQVFVRKVEGELARDEEVAISKKKLQKLTRTAERFEEELEQRVRLATEELKRANRRLADEKERSEGVMRHLADGLVVVDKTGRVVMMNPAAERLLNRESKESLGKSLVEGLGHEHLMAVARGPLDDRDEAHLTKEIELTSKSEATKRVLRASSAVVENESGKMVGMVSVLSDITHEKEVEGMKSHFVSLVTHELRTPVVAIQKSLELILSRTTGEINKDQEKFLSISKTNLERLNRLINDLLDISKLEAGKMALTPSVFDFCDIVAEVKASLADWASDKEITLRLNLVEGSLSVTADRDRMIQVLINLVGNALKFTPAKGDVSIAVVSHERRDGVCGEPCLEVAVEDNGIGIDPKDFKRIFDKFEQVSLVSPPGVGGTGLGLPIAREIITLHGGMIWVESQKGKGSRFIFVIPRRCPPQNKRDGA